MFSPKVPPNKCENEANRAEDQKAGHTGLNAPVVAVGRKLANKIVAQKGCHDVACQADKKPDSDVFHNFCLIFLVSFNKNTPRIRVTSVKIMATGLVSDQSQYTPSVSKVKARQKNPHMSVELRNKFRFFILKILGLNLIVVKK